MLGRTPRIYKYRTKHYNEHVAASLSRREDELDQGDQVGAGVNNLNETGEEDQFSGKEFLRSEPTEEMLSKEPTPSMLEGILAFFKSLLSFVTVVDTWILSTAHSIRSTFGNASLRTVLFFVVLLLSFWIYHNFFNYGKTETIIVPSLNDSGSSWEQRVRIIADNTFIDRISAMPNLDDVQRSLAELSTRSADQERRIADIVAKIPLPPVDLSQIKKDLQDQLQQEIATLRQEIATDKAATMRFVTDEIGAQIKGKDTSLSSEIQRLEQKLDDAIRSLQLDGDVSVLKTQLAHVKTELKDLSAASVATKSSIAQLEATLDRISNEHNALEPKLAIQISEQIKQSEARMSRLVEPISVSYEAIKREVDHLKTSLSAKLDAEFRQELLTKLEQQRAELQRQIDEIRSAPPSPPSGDQPPSTPQLTPAQIVTQQKQTIDGWIVEIVRQMEPEIVAKVQLPQLPTSEEIVRSQKSLIDSWISALLPSSGGPAVIDEQAVAERVREIVAAEMGKGDKERSEKIAALEKRLAELSTKQDTLRTGLNGEVNTIKHVLEALKNEHFKVDDNTINKIVDMLKSSGPGNLNERQIKTIVWNELEVFASDRLNRTDYALASGGAAILKGQTSDNYGGLLYNLLGYAQSPSVIIMPGNTLGQCWAFAGSKGYATIVLPYPVNPTAFTLDHISRGVARDMSSAPKEFQVWGLKEKFDPNPRLLGRYKYNEFGRQVQTFDAQHNDGSYYPVIMLDVLSNHGHPEFTCVYRFRVHGNPLRPASNGGAIGDDDGLPRVQEFLRDDEKMSRNTKPVQ